MVSLTTAGKHPDDVSAPKPKGTVSGAPQRLGYCNSQVSPAICDSNTVRMRTREMMHQHESGFGGRKLKKRDAQVGSLRDSNTC